MEHPIPFNRGQDIGVSLSKGKAEKPDVEEAIEVSIAFELRNGAEVDLRRVDGRRAR
jgi:hypothetical protein